MEKVFKTPLEQAESIVDDEKTLRFSKETSDRLIDALKDTYKDIRLERLPVEKLVQDNDLLNDEDLQSYHQNVWKNAKAKDFHINNDLINQTNAMGLPLVVRKKDGRLLLSDGRHRTRAAYNDKYKYVEYPIYDDE